MRIYLDCCCLQRPRDNQTQPRIRIETEAVLVILASVQNGDMTLLGSEALEYELSRIPDEERRNEAISLLSLATEHLMIAKGMERMADSLGTNGIAAMDSVGGDYTGEREHLFQDMTVREIIAEIKARRTKEVVG